LIGRKIDRWSLVDSDLGKQFVIFLPMVGDPLKHFPFGRPVQLMMSCKSEMANTIGGHKAVNPHEK
jgi:hypothetical protein